MGMAPRSGVSADAASLLKASWQSFYISSHFDRVTALYERVLEFEDFFVGLSDRTLVQRASGLSSKCLIIGLCVDSKGVLSSEDIPGYLLSDSPEQLHRKASRLAGSYIVMASIGRRVYVFSDACASLPCFYALSGDLASSDWLLAKTNGYSESGIGLTMRLMTPIGKSLLFDYTPFNQIKCLLPNHFVELGSLSVCRVEASLEGYASATAKSLQRKAAMEVLARVRNVYSGYVSSLGSNPAPALTAGWDSRLNYAVVHELDESLETFTFRHPRFTDATPDISVPLRITENRGQKHTILNDERIPDNLYFAVKEIYGPYFDCGTTLDLAWTFMSRYENSWLLSGLVLDEVGKNHVCYNVPRAFVTPKLFRDKAYTYSKEAELAAEEWMEDASCNWKRSGRGYQILLDRFAIENRMARWVAQSNQLYSYIGLPHIDLFNCGDCIDLMLQIPLKDRVAYAFHRECFSLVDPELLAIPFNGGDSWPEKMKDSWLAAWLRTRMQSICAQVFRTWHGTELPLRIGEMEE